MIIELWRTQLLPEAMEYVWQEYPIGGYESMGRLGVR